MLQFTALDEAYHSLTSEGNGKERRRKRKEIQEIPADVSSPPPEPEEDTPVVKVLESVPVTHTKQTEPVMAAGTNTYVLIIVVAVSLGMLYDIRASLMDIQVSLRKMAKR